MSEVSESMYLREKAQSLLSKAARIESGEPLCDHHWNGSDRCYECYCTGCGRHIMEAHSQSSVPLAKEAYCSQCSESPEEKKKQKDEASERERNQEIAMLRLLKAKYPDI